MGFSLTQPIQTIKGTKDILPEDVPRWRSVERAAESLLERYGYRELRTPIYEATDLFARGIGESTDIVGKEMFSFDDRGGRHVTLRPENTAGVVRAYIQHKLYTRPLPQKFWYLGPMFRAENVQAGRQRQFHQLGVECLGSDDPRWDAEVMVLAVEFFRALGLDATYRIELNSVGCAICRPAYRTLLQDYLRTVQSSLCRDCCERTERNPLRVLDCKVSVCRETLLSAPLINACWCDACRKALEQVCAYLNAVGVTYQMNPGLVRGLDYYTRTVFELVASGGRLGAQSTVCAGGRYDGLVAELGGPATPAVGWALGLERLLMLLEHETHLPSPQAVVVSMPGISFEPAFSLTMQLRGLGLSVEMAPAGKLERQLKHAERLGARFAVLLGEDELAAEQVVLKDLAARTQQRCSIQANDLLAVMQTARGE
ncbi:MAG: histidine--tRNA ligase [Candidatus Sericytochromatia bacterium]|nr:histidine--tRNA ligase [Candidatus Sericytochromatia bacterium]